MSDVAFEVGKGTELELACDCTPCMQPNAAKMATEEKIISLGKHDESAITVEGSINAQHSILVLYGTG